MTISNKYNTGISIDLPSMSGTFGGKSKACLIEAHGACLGFGKNHHKCRCKCHTNTQERVS